MEWKLTDTRNAEYTNMIKSAQDLELSLGSHAYRGHQLLEMRKNIDISLRKWWEEVLKEMAIDPSKDYMIDNSGCIKEIDRPKPPVPVSHSPFPSKVGTNAAELK